MQRIVYALALAASLGVTATSATLARADAPAGGDPSKTFSDALCPAATDPVRKFYVAGANPNTTVDDFLAQVRSVIDAYERCRSEKLSNGATRQVHYTETRLAQFHYEAGHMQRLADQPADAKKSLSDGLQLANDVANWTTASQSYYSSNNVNVGSGSSHNSLGDKSPYYDSAVAIRDAITKEMGLLSAPAAGASPAASTSPAPAPTST